MFELRPGTGVVLPRRAGMLCFGMAERDAQWQVATLTDVRPQEVCVRARAFAVRWWFLAAYDGVGIDVCGGPAGLAEVTLTRLDDAPCRPAGPAVAWRGVDLFGHPAADLAGALGGAPAAAEPHLTLRRPPGARYLGSVRIRADPQAARAE